MTDHFVITCYSNPDIDGFACVVAYQELLIKAEREARIFYTGVLHDEILFVMHQLAFPLPESSGVPLPEDQVILVDASTLSGIDPSIDPEKVTEVIDHRKVNDGEKFTYAKIQIEAVGSCATLIAEKYMGTEIEISPMAATLLFAAIVSNTLNFKAGVTTDRDRDAAEWLLTKIHLSQEFVDELFIAKSDLRGEKLLRRMVGEFATFAISGKQIGIIQVEIVNAKSFVEERRGEIFNVLKQAVQESGIEDCFVSFIDLNHNRNLFMAAGKPTQKMLEPILHVTFKDGVAERAGLIMRKEIVPLLVEALK